MKNETLLSFDIVGDKFSDGQLRGTLEEECNENFFSRRLSLRRKYKPAMVDTAYVMSRARSQPAMSDVAPDANIS